MSAPQSLPSRPDLHWLKNRAKEHLAELRAANPAAKLADAQRDVARAHGFPSWRALKAHVDELRAAADAAPAPPDAEGAAMLDDATLKAFLRVVASGDVERVRAALVHAPALVSVVGPHPFWGGRVQPLHVAVEAKRRAMVELLLERGADVDGANDGYEGWSPLLIATRGGRGELAELLLARGARVGLCEALALGDDAWLDAILDGDAAAIARPMPSRGTPLHFARTLHAVDRLLALGIPVESRDRWGASAVEKLSRLGAAGAPLVARLAERGAHVGAAELARLGDRAALERRHAADAAAVLAPAVLKAAIDAGQRDVAVWLLDAGADVHGRAGGEPDETPLHDAAWQGDLELVRVLVGRGADVAALDRQYGATPRGWAETAITVTHNPACAAVAEYLRAREGGAVD